MKFVFIKKAADEEQKKISYTLKFLDMKFVIYYHGEYKNMRTFSGFKDDDGDYKSFHNYKPSVPYPWIKTADGLRYLTSDEKVMIVMKNIVSYIQNLYGYETTEIEVIDEFLYMMEGWLS